MTQTQRPRGAPWYGRRGEKGEKILTERYVVEALNIHSASYGNSAMIAVLHEHPNDLPTDVRFQILQDHDGRTVLKIDGQPVDRYALVRWLCETKDVVVEIDRDPEQYGLVTEARFFSERGPQ